MIENSKNKKVIAYTSSASSSPEWYFSQETQAKVAFEKFSGLKINEYISNERVLLLDPKGIPLSSTTKELAIKAAEIEDFVAVEIREQEGESVVQLMDLNNDQRMLKKFGLRTKKRPWLFNFSNKIGSSEVCDAWPRSSDKEHSSVSEYPVLTEHKSHSAIHKCSINKNGNIVGYRQSKLAERSDFICIEPNEEILKDVL